MCTQGRAEHEMKRCQGSRLILASKAGVTLSPRILQSTFSGCDKGNRGSILSSSFYKPEQHCHLLVSLRRLIPCLGGILEGGAVILQVGNLWPAEVEEKVRFISRLESSPSDRAWGPFKLCLKITGCSIKRKHGVGISDTDNSYFI